MFPFSTLLGETSGKDRIPNEDTYVALNKALIMRVNAVEITDFRKYHCTHWVSTFYFGKAMGHRTNLLAEIIKSPQVVGDSVSYNGRSYDKAVT